MSNIIDAIQNPNHKILCNIIADMKQHLIKMKNTETPVNFNKQLQHGLNLSLKLKQKMTYDNYILNAGGPRAIVFVNDGFSTDAVHDINVDHYINNRNFVVIDAPCDNVILTTDTGYRKVKILRSTDDVQGKVFQMITVEDTDSIDALLLVSALHELIIGSSMKLIIDIDTVNKISIDSLQKVHETVQGLLNE